MSDKYFLEWSCSQRCFHVAEAVGLCKKNLEAIISGRFQPDYRPIGIFETFADACVFGESLKNEPSLKNIFSDKDDEA
jgi:hypothetical protein